MAFLGLTEQIEFELVRPYNLRNTVRCPIELPFFPQTELKALFVCKALLKEEIQAIVSRKLRPAFISQSGLLKAIGVMSHTVAYPDLPVNHHADDVAASKTDSKLIVNHSESEATLLKMLDHFRNSFMKHFYEVVAPLYGHHLNIKPSFYLENYLKGSSSHSRKHNSLEERRIHPFVDIWETKTDYFADIEMPGIKNKDSITL